MSRRALVPLVTVAALAFAGGITLAATGDRASKQKRPTRGELYRLQERIDKRWQALARQGIYVMSTGQPARLCVAVRLANPTQPNIEYLRRRFGPHVCVDRSPGSGLQACASYSAPPVPPGSVTVPDLSDLGISEAARRTVASGLTYAVNCLGDNTKTLKRLPRHSAEQLVRITEQCPRAGELVPPGTEVALEGVALLPGGFAFGVGALTTYNTGTANPCADGRNAAPPR